MLYTALIGNPTEHSVSPVMFKWMMHEINATTEYQHLKIDVAAAEDLQKTLSSLNMLGFRGINVTLPYKIEVMEFLDRLDSCAKETGAVNTVTFSKGLLTGYNTDWYGIYQPLLGCIKASSLDSTNSLVITVLGSGGAARAAIYAAICLKAQKIIVVHTKNESQKTNALKKMHKNNNIVFHDYDSVGPDIEESQIVINATSAGMIGQAAAPFDLSQLEGINISNKIFFECVFNPTDTTLLKYFSSRKGVTVDGLWMMIYQGIQALSLWLETDLVDFFDRKKLKILHDLLEAEIERG